MSVTALVGVATDNGASHANHVTGMAAMSIDTNIMGNDADTLGPNNSCVSVNSGDSTDLDVTALDIPASLAIVGFGFTINYDSAAFTVTAGSAAYLLDLLPNSSVFDSSDPPPDTDGTYEGAAADTQVPAAEFGSGVLMRITVEVNSGTNAGLYDLTLSGAAHLDSMSHGYAPAALIDAAIAVGQPCPTLFGDVDCSGGVNSVDALKVLRFGAGLGVSQSDPCVDLGQTLPNTELQGDVDCSNTVNAVDALKLLRYGAGLSVAQNNPCPDVGT
jgi:hypothetical protein